MRPKLPIRRDEQTGMWEIFGLHKIDPTFPFESMGPYTTRKEAEDDRRGQIRFAEICLREGV